MIGETHPADLETGEERRDVVAREARDEFAAWLDRDPVHLRELDSDPAVAMALLRDAFESAAIRARDERRELAELRSRVLALEELTRTDHLTGIGNRLAVEERLEAEWSRARRHGLGLSVIAIDCDGLKQVNDQFGHSTGDRMIREVAQRVQAVVRGADFVGRVGGDEFVVVCPDTDHEGAALATRKIVRSTGATSLTGGHGEDIPIAISAGWAHMEDQADWRELLEDADRALYVAKNNRPR